MHYTEGSLPGRRVSSKPYCNGISTTVFNITKHVIYSSSLGEGDNTESRYGPIDIVNNTLIHR